MTSYYHIGQRRPRCQKALLACRIADCLHCWSYIKELAERLNIPKQHASKIAAKLEELGLAGKARDPRDGRSWLFSLTDDGCSFVGEHITQSNKHLVAYLDSLGEKDRQDLLASLETAARIVGSHHLN